MLIVSSTGTLVKRIFMLKEHILFDIKAFFLVTSTNENFLQKLYLKYITSNEIICVQQLFSLFIIIVS